MPSDRNIALGALVLLLSTLALLTTGLQTAPIPAEVAALAVLGMALGSILVGTAVEGSPV